MEWKSARSWVDLKLSYKTVSVLNGVTKILTIKLFVILCIKYINNISLEYRILNSGRNRVKWTLSRENVMSRWKSCITWQNCVSWQVWLTAWGEPRFVALFDQSFSRVTHDTGRAGHSFVTTASKPLYQINLVQKQKLVEWNCRKPFKNDKWTRNFRMHMGRQTFQFIYNELQLYLQRIPIWEKLSA